MFRFHFVFLMILTLFQVGCFYSSNIDYHSNLKKVPKFLINHFPQDLTNQKNASLIMSLDTTSHCLSYFLFEFDKKDFSVIDQLEKNNSYMQKFSALDSNIITVKRQTTLYWEPEKFRNYLGVALSEFHLPIPYFENIKNLQNRDDINGLFSDNSESGLTDGFVFYVLDHKAGRYWEGLRGLDYMPNDSRNGYSKGIAYDENEGVIIFWFVVW